jgi:hypothetical protein
MLHSVACFNVHILVWVDSRASPQNDPYEAMAVSTRFIQHFGRLWDYLLPGWLHCQGNYSFNFNFNQYIYTVLWIMDSFGLIGPIKTWSYFNLIVWLIECIVIVRPTSSFQASVKDIKFEIPVTGQLEAENVYHLLRILSFLTYSVRLIQVWESTKQQGT